MIEADPPVLTVRSLSVRFRGRPAPAVDGLDLRIDAGEAVLLLGPSGSGKSTVLRAVAGVVPHTVRAQVTGTVEVRGRPVDGEDVLARSAWCGMLQQDPESSMCLARADDEVAFALENRAVPPGLIGGRVHAALHRLGLCTRASRPTASLSAGQRQRVALAAALVAEPDVVVLDEPTALLDPAAAREVGAAIAELRARRPGPAVLLVEHRLDELADSGGLPERVVVLGPDGSVRASGRTDAVLRREARALARDGSWLPLDVELTLATSGAVRAGVGPAGGGWADGGPAGLVEALHRVPLAGPCAAADEDPGRPAAGLVAGGATGRGLAARGVTVRRGRGLVLRDVDLDLRPGEVTALVGRNGTGKTSLLLALAGLLPRSDVSGAVDAGTVGMVFQRPEHQFVATSVGAEVAHGALPGAAEHYLDATGLTDLADRDPFRLSGGQQRLLSLAAMAAQGHDVLLADEPTFGLDRRHASRVAGLLRGLADDGRAVLLSTHDVRLAGLVADRLVVLDGGGVAAAGPVEQVLRSGALERAGIPLPRLLAAWVGTDLPLRPLLRGIWAAVESAAEADAEVVVAGDAAPAVESVTLATEYGDPADRATALPRAHELAACGAAGEPAQGRRAAGSSPTGVLARRNPAVKLCLLLAVSLGLTLIFEPVTPGIVAVLLIALAPWAAGASPGKVARALVPMLWFATGLVVVNSVTRDGDALLSLGGLTVTDQGLWIGAALAARAAAIAVAAVLFLLSTDSDALLRSLERQLRLPPRVAYAVLAAHRLLETLPAAWSLALAAQEMRGRTRRGLRGGGGRRRVGQLSRAAFALLVDSLRRAERLAVALESRGLGDGPRSSWRPPAVGRADLALVLVVVVAATALVLLGAWGGWLAGPAVTRVF